MWNPRTSLTAFATLLVLTTSAYAEPVAVQFQEGVTRAFPTLRSTDGSVLAHGDFVQVARGERVESRLVFRFKDGSLHDEIVVFSQQASFTLQSYRIVQRGPSFPEAVEGWLDRASGRYEVRYRADEDSPEEHLNGTFALPDDAYNGMLSIVVKNLRPGETETVSVVAFTPKPRAVLLRLTPVAEERTHVAGTALSSVRYHIRPQLGLLASLLVVDLPDMKMWIVPGAAPAFLRAEGPLYFMGPAWRIEPH